MAGWRQVQVEDKLHTIHTDALITIKTRNELKNFFASRLPSPVEASLGEKKKEEDKQVAVKLCTGQRVVIHGE
ncbi:MAG: hypothetical protein GF334_02495, partial [Candidatus Altiarchaeales archaeon]|nr:hypothetical protein [Candidatus Altiarchaeales archaeon]